MFCLRMSENFTNFDGTSRKAGPSSKLQLKNAAHGNKSKLFLHIYIFFVLRWHLPQVGPSSKLQLKNAAHTLATLEIFAKIVSLLRYLSACTIKNKFSLCSVKLPQIDIIYPFCKYFSFRLRMCIFFSTSRAPYPRSCTN